MIMPLRVYIFSLFFLTFLYVAFPKPVEASTLYTQSLPSSVITASIEATQDMTYPITVEGTASPQNLFLRIENIGNHTIVNPKITIDGQDWSTIDTILANILSPGMTKEEQAWAIWQFGRTHFYHWFPVTELDWASRDPVRLFNVYGYGFCSDIASAMAALFERAGMPARIWNPRGYFQHVVPEVYYDGDWHMFDADQDIVYLERDNQTVASVIDLIDDPSLIRRLGNSYETWGLTYQFTPKNTVWPANTYYNTGYTTDMILRPRESMTFYWETNASHHNDTSISNLVPTPPVYGAGELVSKLVLTDTDYYKWIVRESGAHHQTDDGVLPAFSPLTTTNAAELVFQAKSPYPIINATLQANFYRETVTDTLEIYTSRALTYVQWLGPELGHFRFRNSAFYENDINLTSYYVDSALPTIHPSEAGKAAYLVLHMHTLKTSSIPTMIGGSFYRDALNNQISISISTDGVTWQQVWQANQLGKFSYYQDVTNQIKDWDEMYVRYEFYGNVWNWAAGAYDLSIYGIDPLSSKPVWVSENGVGHLTTVVDLTNEVADPLSSAAYEYFVRFVLNAANTPSHIGLDSLTLTTSVQVAPDSLPKLALGDNLVVYKAKSSDPIKIRIEHGWIESDGQHAPFAPTISPSYTYPNYANSQFTFRWMPSSDADGDNIIGYHIQICARYDCSWPLSSIFDVDTNSSNPLWTTSYVDWFNPGQTYYWRVKALDGTGLWGDYSLIGSFTLPDSPISGTVLNTPSSGVVALSVAMSSTIAEGSNVRYNWDFGDGNKGSGAYITHTYMVPNLYTVTLTLSNPVNVVTTTSNIEILQLISGAAINVPEIGSSGRPIAMIGSAIEGSNVQYNWDFGDGNKGNGAYITYTYMVPNLYTVTLTLSNLLSVVTSTTSIEIEAPISGVTLNIEKSGAIGQLIQMNGAVAKGTNVDYLWNFGDGSLGNGADVDHTYQSTGVFTIELATRNQVSIVTTTALIQIEPSIQNVVITAPSVAAMNVPVQMAAQIATASDVNYTWDFGDGSTATGAVVEHTYPVSGTFDVTVVAASSKVKGFAIHNIQISDANREPVEQEVGYQIWLPIVSR